MDQSIPPQGSVASRGAQESTYLVHAAAVAAAACYKAYNQTLACPHDAARALAYYCSRRQGNPRSCALWSGPGLDWTGQN